MSAPINDFVKKYIQSDTVRFHMPGHKGCTFHGCEAYDITEIKGADYLYQAQGIIAESERRTAASFKTAKTLFSTEGSSQCIKTMLGIIKSVIGDKRLKIAAPRNVHKAFIDGCILLDADVVWLYPSEPTPGICCCDITPVQIENLLSQDKDIDCLYITSPDYLGNLADIKAIADISHRAGVPLAVDNAHGSYMAFLDDNTHPIALGADMCCDSAHKTLPCYTGGAYLHFSNKSPDSFLNNAKSIMSMFGSTSPSYLILQSLDLCGEMLASGEFAKKLAHSTAMVRSCKEKIEGYGWVLCGQEKMKITVCAAKCGYNGCELGDKLRETGIEPEYCDGEYVVFMAGISNTQNDFDKLAAAFKTLPVKPPIDEQIPGLLPAESRLSMRRAAFSHSQSVDIHSAVGRICALTVTGCQPSVPVTVSGEVVSENAVKLLEACGVEKINVL
ncbi:PLP-dependent transferase [Ruminococcus sp. FC2018]|uniref:PLP-dependent transferase n=1 Tax=Ruminococcus sp. FC2018 TaxID=1410617 RepID=UPI00048F2C26|nr:PLP-dependent transferase [Ruminococcus sp. FC2018]